MLAGTSARLSPCPSYNNTRAGWWPMLLNIPRKSPRACRWCLMRRTALLICCDTKLLGLCDLLRKRISPVSTHPHLYIPKAALLKRNGLRLLLLQENICKSMRIYSCPLSEILQRQRTNSCRKKLSLVCAFRRCDEGIWLLNVARMRSIGG